eukprot:EG_transcript_28273
MFGLKALMGLPELQLLLTRAGREALPQEGTHKLGNRIAGGLRTASQPVRPSIWQVGCCRGRLTVAGTVFWRLELGWRSAKLGVGSKNDVQPSVVTAVLNSQLLLDQGNWDAVQEGQGWSLLASGGVAQCICG